ncbi:hypothetical protein Mal4_20270 [Maioricimonas rarisocia]|uniref:Uncharacterized protein n=1 Tax=Maioricimonas rarisocia TaxID=2528026 RepID=A0A517Z5I4_9PLAN|nr:hypothetical protein [Maioricimonas rarisocia]QDU37711.1 hypothetical protein Mal4_20270 [Maioricimonas rarisocia]
MSLRVTLTLILAAVAFCTADTVRGDDPPRAVPEYGELAKILDANAATIAALHSFHLTVECYSRKVPDDLTRPWNEPLTLFRRFEWFRSGDRERIKVVDVVNPLDEKGLPRGIEDVYRDGTLQYVLGNWDWNDPQPISPARQGSVYASIEQQTSSYHKADPAEFLLLYPRFRLKEPRVPLAEYVKRFATCELVPSDSPSEVRIHLKGPDSLGVYEPQEWIEVVLSADHGYLVREFVRHEPDSPVGAGYYRYEVKSFHDLGGGAFVPAHVEYTISSVELKPSSEFHVTVNSVNAPLPTDVFDFRFPKDVQVVDISQGLKDHKWLLWGTDNQPVMEISSPADLVRIDPDGARSFPGETPFGFILANVAVVLLVLVLVTMYVVRRRKNS